MQEKSDPSEKEEGENTPPTSGPEGGEKSGTEKEAEAGTETGVETEKEAEAGTEAGTEAEAETERESEKETGGREQEEIPLFSMRRRLTKSRKNKILTGVCGGIGEYFDIDPTLVRLAFVLLVFFNGLGIVIYIILAVIMPEGNGVEMAQNTGAFENMGEGNEGAGLEEKSDRMRLLGAVLLIIGIFLFLDRFRIFEMFWWVNKFFWPAVFTAAGAWLLLRNRQ